MTPNTSSDWIPDYMWPTLWRYLDDGVEPGDFLTAVLCNDLREAVARADENNLQAIPAWVAWLYNHAPSPAWGSKERVVAWIDARGYRGIHGHECPREGL